MTETKELKKPNSMRYFAYLAFTLYMISFAVPALFYSELAGNSDILPIYPLQILVFGWVVHPAWFANICFLVAFIFSFFKMYKTSLVLSLFTFILGVSAITLKKFPIPNLGGSEKISGTIDHFGTGFYVWVLSFVTLNVYMLWRYKTSQKESVSFVK